jgi:pimeloyl-ACP methyl ester carboxylesterase
VLDFLKIKKSHFIGISLGTIIIRQLAEDNPGRVQTMILGGAILKMNFRSQVLMRLGNVFKYVLPYLVLYKFFAFVIMPNKNHKQSRILFINEAKKLYQKEFIRWFKLTAEINPVLRWFRQKELSIPTFYVMGEEDYMFLPSVKKVAEKHSKSSKLFVIKRCGHVVNIEQATIFNQQVLDLIVKEYGVEKSAQFCEIAAMMYDIKFNAAKDLQPINEYDFERVWWLDTYIELNKELEII